jgi:hypothetical protein
MMRQLGRSALVLMEWRSSICEESCRLLTMRGRDGILFVVFMVKYRNDLAVAVAMWWDLATMRCCCNVVACGL